jgi:hypothetical protein
LCTRDFVKGKQKNIFSRTHEIYSLLSKDSEKVDCQMAATCSTSGVAGSSEPSLTDIMGVLMTIQNEQNTQKLNMKNIKNIFSRTHEIYSLII